MLGARTRVPNSGPAVWGPAQFKVSAYGLPAVPAREAAGPAEKEPVRASGPALPRWAASHSDGSAVGGL